MKSLDVLKKALHVLKRALKRAVDVWIKLEAYISAYDVTSGA